MQTVIDRPETATDRQLRVADCGDSPLKVGEVVREAEVIALRARGCSLRAEPEPRPKHSFRDIQLAVEIKRLEAQLPYADTLERILLRDLILQKRDELFNL
jgi:hypothetical protein